MAGRAPFKICGEAIAPGDRMTVDVPLSVLSNHTPMSLPVHVVHGRRDGPSLFVSAAIHGDEIQGVEIVRRLLNAPQLRRLRGTLLAVPIVNAFGFINHSRYLPDRRDLNRSFPGSIKGSLAARLAYLFLNEVVKRCNYGIDLHSAAVNRTNLPQVRTSGTNPEVLRLAKAFGAPLVLTTTLRDGSLRKAAHAEGVDVLLYEAGEGLRFDELSIRAGVTGVLRVMRALDMVASKSVQWARAEPFQSTSSTWVRAPDAGILRAFKTTGAAVEAEEIIGVIADPFGTVESEVRSPQAGLVIGRTNLPVVNEGDALFHVATVKRMDAAEAKLEALEGQLQADPLFDEDEII